jgi:flavin-dependent dehydrogenase
VDVRLIVVGGDAAGGAAAANAKRGDPEMDVIIFERGDWTSYSA